jgi:hypothetical protein
MTDPRRLRDDGDDLVVANLLDAARAYRRPVASRNRILKVLGLPVAISVGAPAAAIASSLGTKIVLVVSTTTVLVAGGGAVAYRAHTRALEQERATIASHNFTVSHTRRQPTAVPAPTEPPITAPLEDPPPPEVPPVPLARAVAAHSTVAVAPAQRRQAPGRQARAVAEPPIWNEPPVSPVTGPEPAAIAPSKPTAPPLVSFSSHEPPGGSLSRPSLPSAVPPTAPAPRRAPLAREITLLDGAERAERQQDHRAALARLDEYGREFPDGALLAEAEVLRISALFGAGDAATARARARAFLAGSAPSPLTARVASMLSRASRESDAKEQP